MIRRRMTSFVRFIFFVLVVGILLNLVIVGVANVNSERHREVRTQEERDTFARLLKTINGRLRTADIAVESQIVHSRGTVEKTTLLIRQYFKTETDEDKPMAIQRLTIDGDRINVDGLFLDFDALFAPDEPNLQVLRGMKVAYIDHIYSEQQPADERFTLLPEYRVPELTRIQPVLAGDRISFPSFYELRIWQHLWDYIKRPDLAPRGFTATHLPPASHDLKTGHVYSAMVGPDGISLRDAATPGLLNEMLEQAAAIDKAPGADKLAK